MQALPTDQPALVAPEAKTKDKGVLYPYLWYLRRMLLVLNVKMAGNRIKMIIIMTSWYASL